MDKLSTRDYYLGPEFQQDSSLLRMVADTLILAYEQGIYNPVQSELFLVLTEFANSLQLMGKIKARCGVNAFGSVNQDARQFAAEEFRKKCFLAENVHDQLANFVSYCADQINGKF